MGCVRTLKVSFTKILNMAIDSFFNVLDVTLFHFVSAFLTASVCLIVAKAVIWALRGTSDYFHWLANRKDVV